MHSVGYEFRIDILKAFTIISVILLHALPNEFLTLSQAQFHIWQAVPIFLLLLGMNWGRSYLRSVNFLTYFVGKVKRLGIPLIIFTIITLCFPNNLHFDWALLMGTPPFRGYGSYFIALIFQLLFVIPMMIFVYKKTKPIIFLSIFFIFNFFIELLSPYSFNIGQTIYYSSFSLRYIFIVALGIYFIEHRQDFLKKRMHKAGVLVSIVYLSLWGYKPFYPHLFIESWGWQHLFAFYYTGMVVYIFLNAVSRKFNKKSLLVIGQASFHIFLLQLLFFGLNGTESVLEFMKHMGINNIIFIKVVSLISMLVIIIGSGVIWFVLENRIIWKKYD